MALVDGRVGREEVEVAATLRVPDIGTVGFAEDNRNRVVAVLKNLE
jgi:hypothetical protein